MMRGIPLTPHGLLLCRSLAVAWHEASPLLWAQAATQSAATSDPHGTRHLQNFTMPSSQIYQSPSPQDSQSSAGAARHLMSRSHPTCSPLHLSYSSTATSTSSSQPAAEKSNRIEFSPISKAIALLLSQDIARDRPRVVTSMSKLCLDMAGNMKQYSPTEVAAFCEAAKKLDFCTQALADAVMEYFPGKVSLLHEEELLGVIWVVAKKEDVDSLLARDLGEAVNNHLEELRHEDIPDLLALMASICPASSFLLTAMSDEALSRLQDFSASEVCALVGSFGSEVVRRSLFDDKTFKDLAAHVIKTVKDFTQTELRSILTVYRDICPRRHSLVATLALLEDELAPFVSPSPQ